MANHVTTRVTIDCNETAQVVVEQWREAIEGMDNDDYKMVWKLFGVTAEEVTHQWSIENLGSKWCYSDDIYDNNFTLVSAWDWPDKFVGWMAEQVIALDEDASITVTYEDEGANFVGYHVFTKLGDRGDSTDFDTLVEMVKKAVPEIVELEEGTDEYFDMLYDNIWDAVYAWQEDGLSAT
jgi:hypothetical protein